MSSRSTTTILGAPTGGRSGAGHHDTDSAGVRPILPPKGTERRDGGPTIDATLLARGDGEINLIAL
jgi:hypothetical protein